MSIKNYPQRTTRLLPFAAFSSLFLVSLTLSGCAQSSTTLSSPSSNPSSSSVPAPPIPTASSSPTPTALVGINMDKSCEQIVSLQGLYGMDANLALVPNRAITLGTVANQQASLCGKTCFVTNLSSDFEVQIEVAKLAASSASQLANQLTTPVAPAKAYQVATGVSGTYVQDSAYGTAQFVVGDYWVSLTSRGYKNAVAPSALSYLIWNTLK